MEPTIGGAISRGFRVAIKGWPGIAVYAAGSLLIGLVVIGTVLATGIPQELLQEAASAPRLTAPAQPASAGLRMPSADTAATTEAVDAFAAEEESDTASLASDVMGAGQTVADTLEDEDFGDFGDTFADVQPGNDLAAYEEIALEWLNRAWPLLVVAFIFAMLVGFWLNGGQIGYVGQLEATGKSNLPAFWASASKSFVPLLGAWGISTTGVIVVAGVIGLFGLLLGSLGALPGALLVILTLVFGVAATGGLVWLAVRLVFWFPAIVLDGVGPITGLKTSLSVTRGRWLQIFLLGLVAGLISLALGLVLQVFGAITGVIPGIFGTIVGFIFGLVGLAANLYLGFALLAAYVHYYRAFKVAPKISGGPKPA